MRLWIVDGRAMQMGDHAGICAYLGHYAAAALTKAAQGYVVSLMSMEACDGTLFRDLDFFEKAAEERILLACEDTIWLKSCFDFSGSVDTCTLHAW